MRRLIQLLPPAVDFFFFFAGVEGVVVVAPLAFAFVSVMVVEGAPPQAPAALLY